MRTHPSWDKDAQWVRVYRARIRLGLERCRLCGCRDRFGTDQQLTLDHILPRSLGGTSDMTNATILCVRENNEKANRIVRGMVSLWQEEAAVPRSRRWSLRGVPEVPSERALGSLARFQPPRSPRGRRKALRRALPPWAPECWANVPPGEPIPSYVTDAIRQRHGEVPEHLRSLLDAG